MEEILHKLMDGFPNIFKVSTILLLVQDSAAIHNIHSTIRKDSGLQPHNEPKNMKGLPTNNIQNLSTTDNYWGFMTS